MKQRYSPSEIEQKWQKAWEASGIYLTDESSDAPKAFDLVFFPYPSGDLHIGHWYNFAIGDSVARFHRMQGKNLLFPMGFDAFGLPAENAAIKRTIDPGEWTAQNIKEMARQLKRIGAMFDWERTLSTADPSYYRWTQWLFLKFYEKGLAYQAEGVVNW
jgi:leucyl-tRNA synthetase